MAGVRNTVHLTQFSLSTWNVSIRLVLNFYLSICVIVSMLSKLYYHLASRSHL